MVIMGWTTTVKLHILSPLRNEAHSVAVTAGRREGFSLCVLSFCVSQFVETDFTEAPLPSLDITSQSVRYFCFTMS